MNPACVDLGFAEEESCVMYIGIECDEDSQCLPELSVEYQNSLPKKVVSGSPRHSSLEAGSYSYYYLTVAKKGLADVYAVLMPIVGDLDLFVNFQHASVDVGQWLLPTAGICYSQSKQKLKAEMIRLTTADLETCFPSDSTEDDECVIIYGVYAENSTFATAPT